MFLWDLTNLTESFVVMCSNVIFNDLKLFHNPRKFIIQEIFSLFQRDHHYDEHVLHGYKEEYCFFLKFKILGHFFLYLCTPELELVVALRGYNFTVEKKI